MVLMPECRFKRFQKTLVYGLTNYTHYRVFDELEDYRQSEFYYSPLDEYMIDQQNKADNQKSYETFYKKFGYHLSLISVEY
jgi:hypothetical protein